MGSVMGPGGYNSSRDSFGGSPRTSESGRSTPTSPALVSARAHMLEFDGVAKQQCASFWIHLGQRARPAAGGGRDHGKEGSRPYSATGTVG